MTPTQTIRGANGVEYIMSQRSYDLACEGAALAEHVCSHPDCQHPDLYQAPTGVWLCGWCGRSQS